MRTLPYIALLLTLSLGACDSSFEPLTESVTDFFALYGYLDTEADTQFVRVVPVRPLLARTSQQSDTQVTSTLLGTNERVVWRDSVITLDNGDPGLLFYAPFRAQPGGRYQLDIAGADNKRTQAQTRVPPFTPLRTAVPRNATNGDLLQDITWVDLTTQPASATLTYLIRLPSKSEPERVIVPYDGTSGRFIGDGWVFTINLEVDREEILSQLNVTNSLTLIFEGIEMEIEGRSEEWMRPANPINIENGFGFFGAIATYTQTWTLADADIVQLGFRLP